MLANLLSALQNFTESNFQSSSMFEGSESVDSQEVKTESTLGSSVSACKKVLCSNSALDSSEYWVRNDKTLCRIGFLEEQHDGGCPTICFVNLDRNTSDRPDDGYLKKLATVCPELPRLIESLGVRQPKENEILLLSSLESPDACQHDPGHTQSQRTADICLVHCVCRSRPTQTNSVIFEINKYLIGLQSGQDRQRHGRLAGQRTAEDDTNRSVSSIEEDFLTASEHLGEDSEDDPLKNDSEITLMPESVKILRSTKRDMEKEDSEDSETLCTSSNFQKVSKPVSGPLKGPFTSPKQVRCRTANSAGHFATNLAESVLQDAFISLSQDESSFAAEAAVSVSTTSSHTADLRHSTNESPKARTCSFELPKIVIVQSPDNSEEATEWPDAQSIGPSEHDEDHRAKKKNEGHSQHNSAIGHPAKPLEIALACAASVIGTITAPHVAEQLTLESGEDDEFVDEEEESEMEQGEFSFTSAVCGISQVAGAVAAVELAEDCEDNEDSTDTYSASMGLLSVAQASTAIPLHCSVAEGISVEAFRATVAEVLLQEASAVLTRRQSYSSVANFLETTHYKIVDGITNPRRHHAGHQDVDHFTKEISDNIFQYALEKAEKRKEIEGPEKDLTNIQGSLLDCVNNLLFDVLSVTSRRICEITKSNVGSCGRQEGCSGCMDCVANTKSGKEALSQLQQLIESNHDNDHGERQSSVDKLSVLIEKREREKYQQDENETRLKEAYRLTLNRVTAAMVKEQTNQHGQLGRTENSDSPAHSAQSSPLHKSRGRSAESEFRQQSLSSSTGGVVALKTESTETKTPVTCFAEDLATTVVSMATELAAICLENSSGKQPWFCALKSGSEVPEGLILPCRTTAALRRKETQNGTTVTKKHRPPRLSEIKRKTEEQPELMERLVNRVVDETVNLDEPMATDPFALFASEVTARIMNCPELNVVDTSKSAQSSRSRLQCERWSSRGKASSYESIPEEDTDPSGTQNTLGPGSRLGHNLSRGSSISKQSSCESITDEFSRFMVNQMETEGRGFDLLLDYYAGKNASSILTAAVQQAASKKNGHLNVRTSSCLSKQSSTESITEEFYRFMLKDMDKENREFSLAKTKEWSNSLLPPSPRAPFCIRQSSVPDRRSSDSRLTVNSPIKANSFDGFARNVHGDSLNIFPTNSVSSMGLCKSDSCLYKRGQTDQITDMLINETWASSIESLMRKNKIIAEPSEDSVELDSSDSQPHVQLFANRLAADIVESGKSLLGGQQDIGACQSQVPVGERRYGFKQSRQGNSGNQDLTKKCQEGSSNLQSSVSSRQVWRGQRDVPLIHIEPDQKEAFEDMERESQNQQFHHNQPQSDKKCGTSNKSRNGNSSTSSLGLADLEGFLDYSISNSLISEDRERKTPHCQDQSDEATSGLSTAGSSCQRELLVMNLDLDPECVDAEMRTALQWIAASELGVPALYFRKTQDHNVAKFHRVVQLAGQKAWRVGDLFSAVAHFCQHHQDHQGRPGLGLFDWILKTKR